MADRALTVTELAGIAGATRQTISAHLAKLVEANLVAVHSQGRHRYFRLADRDVAQLLESLMGVAFRAGAVHLRSSPREPALRKARACYDHLAGERGVMAYDALLAHRAFDQDVDALRLTATGRAWFAEFGIDADVAARKPRALRRPCLDWSERRHHLGGALGADFMTRLFDLGWARREKNSRVVSFSWAGEARFRALFSAFEA
jgi:hypothetical protein